MVVATEADRVLARAIEAGGVPGVVGLAADDRGVLYAGAFGKRELGGDSAMTLDTVFAIASMTKAITSVAAMQLVERGRVTLDEPLGERLPELGAVQVLDGFDAAGAPRLRPPRRAVTLRHLLTHTAGFGYAFLNTDLLRLQEHCGRALAPLETPMVSDPGVQWEYGVSTDWAGRLVEHISGHSLEQYFREQILDPLGMVDTGFVLRADRRSRLVSRHQREADGSLRAVKVDIPDEPKFQSGGGGLFGTGPDYLRFLRMLLGDGELDGTRVLRRETVGEMARNQIGELAFDPPRATKPASLGGSEFFPGIVKKWGLAGFINTVQAPTGRSAGSWAWAGAFNTYFWIDPTRRLTGLIMTQIQPFGDAAALGLFGEFERSIYESVS